jgi:hypothetical protein
MCRKLLFAGLVFLFSSQANAIPVSWELQNWLFNDGGSASGSFVFDADANAFSAISITTTAGSLQPGASYGVPNPFSPGGGSFGLGLIEAVVPDLTGAPNLYAELLQDLTNSGGVIAVNLNGFSLESTCGLPNCSLIAVGGAERRFLSGSVASVSPVPVPAAVWLFGTALIGLVGFGKRKKAA